MFNTVRSKLLISLIFTAILTLVLIAAFVQDAVDNILNESFETNAQNSQQSIVSTVQNEYKSIEFHRENTLNNKKKELKKISEIAFSILNYYQKAVENREISLKEAQSSAIKEIENIRYDNDIGYYWINSVDEPFPYMIMHPTIPELNGKKLKDSRFNCIEGTSENLFVEAVRLSLNNGDGYIHYFWPKPTESGLTEKQPKLSYVFLYEPWQWVIGSGIYIYEIEKETQKRMNSVIAELQETISRIRLFKTGYVYIFNGDFKTIYHPYYDYGWDSSVLKNPESGNNLISELVNAAKTTGQMTYKWSKPGEAQNKLFKKKAYITYFEPLDWYITTTVYVSDMKHLEFLLLRKIIIISFLGLISSILLIIYFTSIIISPLNKLTQAAKQIEINRDFELRMPIAGAKETKALGKILNQMLQSLLKNEIEILKNENRLKALIENSPDAILMINQDGNILIYNDRLKYRSITRPESIYDLIHSTYYAYLEDNLEKTFKYNKSVSFECKSHDLKYWYQISIGAIPQIDGKKNATVIISNITEIKNAQNEIESSYERFKTVLDSIDSIIYVADIKTYEILFVNKYLRDIYGDIEGKTCWQVLQNNQTGPCDFCTNSLLLDYKKNPTGIYSWQFKNTVNNRWYEIRDQLITWTNNRIARMEIATDIHDKKLAEEKIKQNLQEKEVLLKEIHHRVKNNIQIIYSLLKMQSRYVHDKRDEQLFIDSENRVKSMAIIHEQLYESSDLAHIDFENYTKLLTTELSILYNSNADISINIKDIFLNITLAIPCGLIINELVSNSLKYAAIENEKLNIYINFKHSQENYLLEIGDNGKGLPEDFDLDNLNSLGLQLIKALNKQLRSTLTIDKEKGTHFRFEFENRELS